MDKLITIQDFTTMDLVQATQVCLSVDNFKDLYSLNLPTLRFMGGQYGKDKLEAVIAVKIDCMLDFFNLKRSMSDPQKDKTAELILQEYYWLTLSDIDICFNRAMKGDYGQLYSAIDGQVILEWFRKYSFERFNEMEQMSIDKHLNRNKSTEPMSPKVAEAIKKILKPKDEGKKIAAHDPSKIEKRAWEIFSWLDKRQKKKLPKSNIPVIVVGGRHYTQDAFTAYYFNKQLASQKNETNE